ncbi:unnamed protein product [Prorocentrum cordatum]|uniref:Uncharacterized protein n=1 Tax=Prorocentrum cordatum TaxID=2364126 RepID=A0ABN9XH29_9DINO|nr:unnamed protein product [Polarella glacialis]
MIQHDQGAFDETILEVLGLENSATSAGPVYDSHCLPFAFPSEEGNEMIALYAMCWWNEVERLAGKPGKRRSRMVGFVDPRRADINHVVGFRGTDVPALLYHFAGRSKEWDEMLAKFGIPRRHTADCAKVFRVVDEAAGQRACVPGNAGVEDLFGHCPPDLTVC